MKNFLDGENFNDNTVLSKIETDKSLTNENITPLSSLVKPKCVPPDKNLNDNIWYTGLKDNNVVYVSQKTQNECLKNLKREYGEQENFIHKNITLAEWYKKWLKLYKMGKVKATTIIDYENVLKHVPKKLLNKEIDKITLEELLTTINQTKAERMKQKVYELLSALFLKAKNHDYIEKNLMERIEKPKHVRVNSQAFTKKQEEEFVNVCTTCAYGDYFLIALYQGLRRGEALGITYEDVDLANEKLSINKSLNYQNKFDTTKNYQSNRTMPLFKKSLEILKRHHGAKRKRIFNVNQNKLFAQKTKLQGKLSFKFKIKDLRTTFITRCQEKGIPEFVIQSWVGHKIGSKVTKMVYTKFNEEDNVKYINIFEDEENRT